MIQFTITIAESNNTASIRIDDASKQPTALEIAVLKSECGLGFGRHSDPLQHLAKAVLSRLEKNPTATVLSPRKD